MNNLKQFMEAYDKGLTIFDVDDTLFKTKARVLVRKIGGGTSKPLSPRQFNVYKLGKEEYYDYGEFRSSKLFFQTATPIGRMIKKAKAIIRNAVAKGSKVIIVTARSDMDDRDLFIKTFEMHGIPMDNVHIYRAGNSGKSSAKAKQIIFKQFLDTGKFGRIRLFDDHVENLKALLDLQSVYPDVEMFAYKADAKGSVKRIK